MGNCRSRGILVKSDNGLIEGCTISGCGMSAISIGPEYSWGEADYSRNVTIRGNKLMNNVLNGSEAGVIFVHGDGAMGNGNIAITGNLFDKDYGQIAQHWCVSGTHYAKTAEAWLVNMDANRAEIWPLFEQTYGADQTKRWWAYWRVFYLACAELWAYREGDEWHVSHYLFCKPE